MKKAFFLFSVLIVISCNPKSAEKMKEAKQLSEEDNPIGEIDALKNDSLDIEGISDTIVEGIVTEEADNEDKLELIFEFKKTPCFGTCPSFSVMLFSNGRIFYRGESNVEKIGYFGSTVNSSFIYTLFQEADKIDFFNLSENYPTDKTELPDLPKTIIYLKNGEREHRIVNAFYAPLSLQEFEKYLQEKIEGLYWTKIESKY